MFCSYMTRQLPRRYLFKIYVYIVCHEIIRKSGHGHLRMNLNKVKHICHKHKSYLNKMHIIILYNYYIDTTEANYFKQTRITKKNYILYCKNKILGNKYISAIIEPIHTKLNIIHTTLYDQTVCKY
jgi:regulator of sigma D